MRLYIGSMFYLYLNRFELTYIGATHVLIEHTSNLIYAVFTHPADHFSQLFFFNVYLETS